MINYRTVYIIYILMSYRKVNFIYILMIIELFSLLIFRSFLEQFTILHYNLALLRTTMMSISRFKYFIQYLDYIHKHINILEDNTCTCTNKVNIKHRYYLDT